MKKKVYQLQPEDTFEDGFNLYAVYTDEDDYRLAYLLNVQLGLHFKKTEPLTDPQSKEKFAFFEFKDNLHYRNWYLLQNSITVKIDTNFQIGLFGNDNLLREKKIFFFKELPKARYLLKIEAEEENAYFENTLQQIKKIPLIYTIEKVDTSILNSKKLMLF